MHQLLLKLMLGLAVLASSSVKAEPGTNAVLGRYAQDLAVLEGEKLVSINPARFLQAPYTILYFGAGWCPDCRRFSPSLVAAYDRQPRNRKQFEVLLLSQDKNAEGLLNFMRTEKMTWPTLPLEKLADAQELRRFYSGHGIPCLTIIDRTGAIVLQSKDDQDANEVLQRFENLLQSKKTDESGSAGDA